MACISCAFFIMAAETAPQLLAGAELDEFAARFAHRNVARREVEGVAGLVDLLAVAEAVGQPALEHVSPVRARAAASGSPFSSGVASTSSRNDTNLTV